MAFETFVELHKTNLKEDLKQNTQQINISIIEKRDVLAVLRGLNACVIGIVTGFW
jgi:hypothetical protein